MKDFNESRPRRSAGADDEPGRRGRARAERGERSERGDRGHRDDRGAHAGHGPRGGHGFGPRGRGYGRPGGWQQADLPAADDAADWFAGRLPTDWYTAAPTVSVDREEITVTGPLAAPDGQAGPASAEGRISRFREDTRAERMAIAEEAQARYGRRVAWGASIRDTAVLFTHLSVPVMTRLRQPERRVLDTLVDAGVARSRADALAWCVNLVGEHTDQWLGDLRAKMAEVDKLRAEGPQL